MVGRYKSKIKQDSLRISDRSGTFFPQLVFYLEACESGSMFHKKLKNNIDSMCAFYFLGKIHFAGKFFIIEKI